MAKNSALLDGSSGITAAKVKPFAALDAVQDLCNLLMVYAQLPKLLAQLDTDDLTTSNYAGTLTPANPAGCRAAFNSTLAKLDTDAKPASANYAALLTANTDDELRTQWPKLLAKLDLDDNADNTYAAKNTLTFLVPIDSLPAAL